MAADRIWVIYHTDGGSFYDYKNNQDCNPIDSMRLRYTISDYICVEDFTQK